MSNFTNTTLVEEATSPIGLHLIGMGFAALSSLCSTTGILMQKHSAHVEAGRHLCFCGAGGKWKWRFWLGFTINTGSEAVLSTVALYFTPLSLIAPLGGLSVIFNALLTRFGCVFGIKEVMTRNGWIATLVVLAGVTLVSMSGPGSDGDGAPIKIEDLPPQMAKPLFVTLTVIASTVVLGWIAVRKLAVFKPIRPAYLSLTASIFSGVTAACCGAYSVMFLKVVSVGVPAWIQDPSDIPHPLFFVAVFVVATVAPTQLWLLNLSLAAGKATFAVPLYISLLMVFMSVFGGILFDEFVALLRPPVPLYIFLYVFGVILIIVGLFWLSNASGKGTERSRVEPVPEHQLQPIGPAPGADESTTAESSSQSSSANGGRALAAAPAPSATPKTGSAKTESKAKVSPGGSPVDSKLVA